ncbi:amidase [Bosea sp. NPDC055332]
MSALHELSIAEAAAMLRRRELTARDLTQAYFARIGKTNATLNAYITVTAEAALAQAEAADRAAATGRFLGPLHGIPIALKDVIATAGIRTTCHSRLLLDNVPGEDAASYRRLREAGAILLGKLATHEFAFGGPSHDLPFPPARNPLALDHVTGGSSSGSGAALAAGLCAGSLGTDTSGSIRMPAGHCGVVGLKPSYGRVSRRGVYPLSFSLDHVGPMARSVADCAALLQAIAGHDPDDPGSTDRSVPDFSAALGRPIAGLRIGIDRSWYQSEACGEMVAAVEAALAALQEQGARIVELALPDLAVMNACGRIILLSEGYAVHAEMLARRPQDYGAFTRDRMRLGGFISAADYVRAQRLRRRLIAEMAEMMGTCDVLVTANQYGPAERFDEATETFPFFGRPFLTMPFSLTGQPALTLPCGHAGNGLPLGIQIVGAPFDEATVLQVGAALERGLAASATEDHAQVETPLI